MTYHTFSAFASSVLLLLVFSIAPVQAQDWRQEVQVVTTVGYGDPLHVFVDSLSRALARNPNVLVRREAQDANPIPFGQLREDLYEDGLDLNSASHMFIRYRFDLEEGSQLVETVKDLYFIYRGNEGRADLPILHVSAREPIVGDIIRTSGVPSLVNMEAVKTFREMLAFPYLNNRQETAMVEIAGRPLRGGVSPEERIIKEFLTEHLSVSGGSYRLVTPPAAVAAQPSTDSTSVRITTLPQQ